MPTTSCPASRSSATRYPQMKPAAPVTRTFIREPFPRGGWRGLSETDGSCDAPDVDDLAAVELKTAIRAVRRADDDSLGLAKHLVERLECLVDDVRVGAHHPRALELGE